MSISSSVKLATDVVTSYEKERGKGPDGSDNYPINYTCSHGVDKSHQFCGLYAGSMGEYQSCCENAFSNPPNDPISTDNMEIRDNICDVFDIVDLTSEDSTISEGLRQETLREIESHAFMTDETKRAAVAALALGTAERQRAGWRRNIQNESHSMIMDAANTGNHEIKQNVIDRVRSVVNMVSKIKRDESRKKLQKDLEQKESELDRALQDKSLLQKQQDRIVLNVAGFHNPRLMKKIQCC